MIFSNCQIAKNAISISINGVPLQQVHETKFLGVVISDHLKWKKQIDVVVQKISKVIGYFIKSINVLHKDKLKLLYNTLLEPYMYITYCCSAWSSPYKNGNLDRILKLQKAAVRVISHSPYLADSDTLLNSSNILQIYDLTHFYV